MAEPTPVTRKELEAMDLDQLKAFGKDQGLDPDALATKKDAVKAILELIKAAAAANQPPAPPQDPAPPAPPEPPAPTPPAPTPPAELEPETRRKKPGTVGEFIAGFFNALPLKFDMVKGRGDDRPQHSLVRRLFNLQEPEAFVHVEELVFYGQSGYDSNFQLNAVSAAQRAVSHQFGGLDRITGTKLFDGLPKFSPDNRLVVLVAILPPDPNRPDPTELNAEEAEG